MHAVDLDPSFNQSDCLEEEILVYIATMISFSYKHALPM